MSSSSNILDQVIGGVAQLVEPTIERHLLPREPLAAAHAAPIGSARRIYRGLLPKSWVIAPKSGPSLRLATPAERIENDDAAWIADGPDQLKLELERSAVAVIEVAADVYSGAAPGGEIWAGLVQSGALQAPAIRTADGTRVITIWSCPQIHGAPIIERRRFILDTSSGPDFARVRAHTARVGKNVVPLPSLDTAERWVQCPATAPTWPEELRPQLIRQDCVEGTDPDLITAWLATYYQPSTDGAFVTRDACYQDYLTVNQLTPSDLSEEAFSDGAHDIPKKRASAGYRWLIERRPDVPLRPVKGVLTDTISAADLSAFREWRAARELSPQRRRERAELQRVTRARVEQEGAVRKMYGSQATLDHLNAIKYFEYHNAAEARRCKGATQYGEEYVPLSCAFSNYMAAPNTRFAEASWWTGVERMTDPAAIYKLIVQRVIEGAK